MSTTKVEGQEKAACDPVALAESFASAADKSAKLLGDFLVRQGASPHPIVSDEFGLTKAHPLHCGMP